MLYLILLQICVILKHMILQLNVPLNFTDIPFRVTLRLLLILAYLLLKVVLYPLL